MAEDIIFKNLEPLTVKGTSAPIISTKVGQRDGTRAGSGGGGASGLYNINNMSLLGLFRINSGNDVGGKFSYQRGVLAHNPPHGGNGSYGSFFIDGRDNLPGGATGDGFSLAEYQIPETLSDPSITDPDLIVSAVQLQEYHRIENILGPQIENEGITAMGLVDGRLFVHTSHGYWDGPNPEGIGVINNPNDLSTTDGIAWGQMEVKHAIGNDHGSTYFGVIPVELQSLFNNNTHYWGNAYGMSRIARTSGGPSLLGFKPNNYVSSGILNYDEFINYVYGERVLGELSGVPRPAHYAQKDGYSELYDELNQKAALHYLSFFGNTSQIIEIDPPVNKSYTWQVYKDWHETDPRVPWSTLPPPPGPLNDIFYKELTGVALAFFVPGTKTYLAIGTMKGRRYGGGYKMTQWQNTWPGSNGGPVPLDRDDFDHYYWAFNIDDILAAANPWDVNPYEYGVFQAGAHPWTYYSASQKITTRGGGFFDVSTNRVYIPREKVKSNNHQSQTIVEVYQV